MRTSKDPKTTYLRYRVSPSYKHKVETLAQRAGLSLSDLMRRAVDALEMKNETGK